MSSKAPTISNSRIIARIGFLLVGLLLVQAGLGQATSRLGAIPEANLRLSISDRWAVQTTVESRLGVARGSFDGQHSVRPHDLTDLSLIAVRGVRLNDKVAIGYLWRIRADAVPVHRAVQQYTLVQRLERLRLAHRFAADQTFATDAAPIFRGRYRLGTEIGLQGQTLNTREFYLKIQAEVLGIWTEASLRGEVRVVPAIGLRIDDHHKVELGLDSRYGPFRDAAGRLTIFGTVSYYATLDVARRSKPNPDASR